MDLTTTLVYVTAGLAGAINALAGGGTLLTFPALLPLMTPTQANMTSTIALLPGSMTGAWTYRREIGSLAPWFMRLLPASLVGSLIGSLLLALDPSDTFKIIVPWLILFASLLFLAQPWLARAAGKPGQQPGFRILLIASACQLAVSIYGGYFGAGIGILMLATLGLWGAGDLHQINGLKNLLAACINGVSVGVFAWQGGIVWSLVPGMAAASVVGAYLAASFGKRLPKPVLRLFIITVGFLQTFYYLFRQAGILPGLNFVSS